MSESSNTRGNLFVVCAPSGAGKTSLVQALVDRHQEMAVVVSHTTRRRRPEETDGVNYHFVDEETFRRMASDGAFLEWAGVFGNLYGTSRAAVDDALGEGKHLILEIDWQGAAQIRKAMPAALTLFILPPSLAVLHERLVARGQDDEATVERRMASARKDTSHFDEFDYLIVNDDFDTALKQVIDIVGGRGETLTTGCQRERLADLIGDLLPGEAPEHP